MAPGGGTGRWRRRAREKDRRAFAGSLRGMRREEAGKKWTERLRCAAQERRGRNVALRCRWCDGERRGGGVPHGTGASPCRSGSRRHGWGSETEQEERKVCEVVVDLGTRLPASMVVASCDYAAAQLCARSVQLRFNRECRRLLRRSIERIRRDVIDRSSSQSFLTNWNTHCHKLILILLHFMK